MRENVARRTLIHANPQLGPFRPIDIYEGSQDDDDDAYGQLVQWLLQQVMHQLLHLHLLATYHH